MSQALESRAGPPLDFKYIVRHPSDDLVIDIGKYADTCLSSPHDEFLVDCDECAESSANLLCPPH